MINQKKGVEIEYQPQPESFTAPENEENSHFVSDKLFNMINAENGPTLTDSTNEQIASNLDELLETIEKTIEPLLSGILLKHRIGDKKLL